jgi:23S rRNA (adenine-N6)-dimethyltransferase
MKELSHTQNFIKSAAKVSRFVDIIGISPNDTVIEIGPGRGKITQEINKRGPKIIGIELDPQLAQLCQEKFAKEPRINILNEDIHQYEFPKTGNYMIISNLPFDSTAEILNKINNLENLPEASVFIIQKEAAQRFAGSPYADDSQISILMNYNFEIEVIEMFRKEDFTPVPGVTPVAVYLSKRENSGDYTEFKKFVLYGFNQWKKDLATNLEKIFTYQQTQRLFKANKISRDANPRDLNFNQWNNMFEYYKSGVEQNKKVLVEDFYKKYVKDQSKVSKRTRTDETAPQKISY